MGTGPFVDRSQIANDQDILPDHVLQFYNALVGTIVGRNISGARAAGQDLGELGTPFGTLFARVLNINGQVVDTGQIASSPNRIVSGKTSALSAMPKFIEIPSSGLSCKILGADTTLSLVINGVPVTISSDVNISSLTGAPVSNTTARVNEPTLGSIPGGLGGVAPAGEPDYAYNNKHGELSIDNAESEWVSRVGQWISFTNSLGSEISHGFLESSDRIVNLRRSWFFNSSNNGIGSIGFGDNELLRLLNTGWIFVDATSLTTPEVSYRSPVYSDIAPTGVTGAYWFHSSVGRWKRYDGSQWVIVDRIPIGIVVMNSARIVGYRCFDFSNQYSITNETQWQRASGSNSSTQYFSRLGGKVSVYGNEIFVGANSNFDITRDFNGTETHSTRYYMYITEKGHPEIRPDRPQYRPDLKGYYHPFESWRCVCTAYNSGTSNFVDDYVYFPWQKYNPNGVIPTRFSAKFASNGTLSKQSPVNFATDAPYVGNRHRVNFLPSFFTDEPSVLGLTPDSSNLDIVANLDQINFLQLVIATGNSNSVGSNNHHSISAEFEVSYSNEQMLQAVLDNQLKG